MTKVEGSGAEMGADGQRGSQLDKSQTQITQEPSSTVQPIWKFRLYIAGDAPQSMLAIANLEALCSRYLEDRCQIEIIDLLLEPRRYLEDEILVTPTLVRYEPGPVCTLIGNLSNNQEVLKVFGLTEKTDGP